jgi:CheY-like chemotaxis protein
MLGRVVPPRSEAPLSDLTVLLVDDDEDALELLANALRHAGARVESANGVDLALQRFLQGSFDVVISDLVMPDGGGYRLMEEIRRLPEASGRFVPAIAMSSNSDEGTRRTALRGGFWRFIPKPIDLSLLHGEIMTVGSAYKQSRALPPRQE